MLAVTIAHAVNPSAIVPHTYDPIARAVGWETLGARVAAVRAADAADLPPGHRVWVAANRYQDASELAFHIPDHPTVFALNIASRANEYDLWPSFVDSARPGDDLVLVVDDDSAGMRLVDRVGSQFARRAGGERVALHRRDAPTDPVARRQIWLLRDWSAH